LISIMILDDQPAILQGLKELVEKTGLGRVVATETNGHEALVSVLKHHPELILLDVSMPEMSGVEFAMRLKKLRKETKILAVSAYANNVYVRGMFNAGANGYLLKDNVATELISAIQTVMDGGKWISEGLTEDPPLAS